MKTIFHIICSLSSFCAFSSENLLVIPQNEQAGEELVKEGKLDSHFFELIKPYYSQPIDVPHGELVILLELLPQLFDEIPVLPDSLKRYHPWDETSKSRFFQDYPVLAQFEPLLRFDLKPLKYNAKTAFSIRSRGINGPFSHGANLSLFFSESFKADARITFNNDYARWHRRNLLFTPSEKCTLQFGNFGSFFDKGLFFGCFPRSNGSDSIHANWLYGNTAAWNGFKIRAGNLGAGLLQRFSTDLFFHKRPAEAAYGAILNLKANDRVVLSSGLSQSNLCANFSDSGNHRFVHCGARLKLGTFDTWIQSGFNIRNPGSVPLLIESKFKLNKNKIDLTYIFLPEGFQAPASYLIRKLGDENHLMTNRVSSLHIQTTHRPSGCFLFEPSAYIVFEKQNIERSVFKLSSICSFRDFRCNVTYRWIPSCRLTDTAESSLHNILSLDLAKKINIRSEIDISSWDRSGCSLDGCLGIKLEVFPAVSMKPSVYFSKNRRKKENFYYGIEQILKLHEKTYTQLLIEQSINPRPKGEFLRVEAKQSFLF